MGTSIGRLLGKSSGRPRDVILPGMSEAYIILTCTYCSLIWTF